MLSEYETAEAEKVVEHRRVQLMRPDSRAQKIVDDAGRRAIDTVRKVPGADKALELASAGYEQAVTGLSKALRTSARLSLRDKSLLRRYARHDSTIKSIRDVRRLDLEVIDRVRPRGLGHRYALGAAAEGAAGGFLIAGGEIIAAGGALAGAGAGAAPGIGIAAAVFAADTATVLVGSTRLVLQTASYYGFDPHDEREQLFAAAVLNLGTASGTVAKSAAYAELYQLANLLARSAPWVKLNQATLTKILQPVFIRLSERLTKMKLGQIVPVAGIVVGSGMNYMMLDRVGEAAHWAYRERFLREKGYPFEDPSASTTVDGSSETSADADEADVISVLQIVEESDLIDGGTDRQAGSTT